MLVTGETEAESVCVSATGQGIQKEKRILDFDEQREHFQVA